MEKDTIINFEEKELNWIKELVEAKLAETDKFYTYDRETFESILLKIKNRSR